MKFILGNWVKYYTKEAVKTLKVVTIGSAIIISIASVKYKPAYKVTLAGETIGFVENEDVIKAKVEKYMNDTSGNVAFREISETPKYEFKFINRDISLEENSVMLAIKDNVTTTYKTYAITSDGEYKVILSTQEEANEIINEIKTGLEGDVELNLGIVDVYTTELNYSTTESAKEILNEIKTAKISEYETQKAEAEKKAKEEAAKKFASASKAKSYATTATSAPSGSVNGLAISTPVNGTISSRFGSRSSIRSSVHTGLDIATSLGTGIRPIAAGTVTYAAYKGSYGNLVIIDHGNGIQSYYAHCNALYVSVGDSVDTSSTIAAVGSTGNSTGPHLHLEIRINGTPVNPQNYLY